VISNLFRLAVDREHDLLGQVFGYEHTTTGPEERYQLGGKGLEKVVERLVAGCIQKPLCDGSLIEDAIGGSRFVGHILIEPLHQYEGFDQRNHHGIECFFVTPDSVESKYQNRVIRP
jgi:hypothetical protein